MEKEEVMMYCDFCNKVAMARIYVIGHTKYLYFFKKKVKVLFYVCEYHKKHNAERILWK